MIEDICESGFDQLYLLAISGHYDHVMECLICITPFFATDELADETDVQVGDVDMLTSSLAFMKAIENIVNADQTYFKMAKDLIVTDFPGPVLKEFGNMISKQIRSYKWYGFKTEASIIMLWLKVFVKIPHWNNTKTTLFMVDVLCNHVLLMQKNDSYIPTLQLARDIFTSSLRHLIEKEKTGNHGGFLAWMSGNNKSSNYPTVLVYPSCALEFPHFAFFALEAEEEFTSNSDLWCTTLDVLGDQASCNEADVGIDKIIANASNKLDVPVPSITSLPIYKWSYLVLDVSIQHPMAIAFGQKFFWSLKSFNTVF